MSQKEDKHPILKIIPTDEKITRQELSAKLNMGDRKVRDLINKAKKDTAILFNSSEKGYRRAKPIDKCTNEELQQEVEEVQHSINYLRAIKEEYNYQLRPLIAYLKMAQKRLDTTNIEPTN